MNPETRTPPGEGGAGEARTVAGTASSIPQTTPPDNTLNFLGALYADLPEGAPWFYLWTFPDQKTRWFTDPDTAGRWIAEHGDGRDVYCGIALADHQGTDTQRVLGEPDPKKPDGLLAGGLVAVVADVDIAGPGHTDRKRYPPNLDAALALVQALPIPPTYTVHSGGGLHLWWILREPWDFDGADEREQSRELLRGWGATVQAAAKRMGYDVDPVHDLARVLRVPGTTNHKDPVTAKWSPDPNHRRPVTLLEANPDRRYNPGDFEEYFPEDFDPREPGAGKIALGDLALPEGAETELVGRFATALQQDRRLAATWERTRTDLRDPSPSGYDMALADRLAVKHRWTAAEVAWAVQHSRREHKGDKPLHATKLWRTVAKAMAAADEARARAQAQEQQAGEQTATVEALLADVARTRDPNLVWQAIGTLATLGKGEYATAKQRCKELLRDRLNLNDLEAAIREERRALRWTGSTRSEEGRPVVVVGRQLRDVTADALKVLYEANDPPTVFVRTGSVARIVRDENKRPVISTVGVDELRHRLSQAATFVRITDDGERDVDPPEVVVRNVLAEGEWRFPALSNIVEVPVLRPDGTVLDRPGYDPSTCLFFAPSPGLSWPPIPDRPTPDERVAAVLTLDEAIGEFPYQDKASFANALGLLLTPVVRPAIPGPVPLALLDAPQAGTGKTLVSEVVSTITTGRSAAMYSAPRDDAEWQKKITAALHSGASIVTFDNLERPLEAPSLALALTANTVQDRILGRNDVIVTLPQRATWIVTGNNITLKGDMPRRCYWCRLDAQVARPWQREHFQHPSLLKWVRAHRGELIAALLTLARSWFAEEQPAPNIPTRLGSFEEWQRMIAGILELAEVPDFLGNLQALYDQADEETQQWESFLRAWIAYLGPEPVTTGTLCNAIEAGIAPLFESVPDVAFDKSGVLNRRSFGTALKKKAGVRFGDDGIHIASLGKDSHANTLLWKVRTAQ